MAEAILLLSSMMRKADLQQALRNHEQAGRAGAIKIFAEEVDWMRQRAQKLRLALQ